MPTANVAADAANARCCPINPDAIYSYVDLVRVWCRYPPRREDLAPLHGLCGRVLPMRPKHRRGRWTIWFFQPRAAALAAIARRRDWRLCYAELALDWIFHDWLAREDAAAFFDRHHVQPWHRGEVGYCYGEKGCTRYSRSDRKARINIAMYHHRRSKVTGEQCVHIDGRIFGADALRRFGVHSAADLLEFDHRAFWRRYLLICDLDYAGFGRQALNRQKGTRRRKPFIRRFGRNGQIVYDFDERTAYILFRLSPSMQALIHDCQRLPTPLDVRRYLDPMDVDHLLPTTASSVITRPILNQPHPSHSQATILFTEPSHHSG